MDDPFDYPEPFKASKLPEKREELINKRREYRSKKLGRPIGKHGGYRPGAGRKKTRNYTHIAYIKLDNILMDTDGGIKICDFGVSRLITKN